MNLAIPVALMLDMSDPSTSRSYRPSNAASYEGSWAQFATGVSALTRGAQSQDLGILAWLTLTDDVFSSTTPKSTGDRDTVELEYSTMQGDALVSIRPGVDWSEFSAPRRTYSELSAHQYEIDEGEDF